MGLQNKILSGLAKAFDTSLADAVQPFTLYKGPLHYDSNTGNVILGETSSTLWRGVFSKPNKRTIEDEATLPVNVQIICLANEPNFPPDVNDTIITDVQSSIYPANNECFRILRADLDPSFSVYTLYCEAATHGPIQRRVFT